MICSLKGAKDDNRSGAAKNGRMVTSQRRRVAGERKLAGNCAFGNAGLCVGIL
jgi:hypothetical protein